MAKKKYCQICSKSFSSANYSRHYKSQHVFCPKCQYFGSLKKHCCFWVHKNDGRTDIDETVWVPTHISRELFVYLKEKSGSIISITPAAPVCKGIAGFDQIHLLASSQQNFPASEVNSIPKDNTLEDTTMISTNQALEPSISVDKILQHPISVGEVLEAPITASETLEAPTATGETLKAQISIGKDLEDPMSASNVMDQPNVLHKTGKNLTQLSSFITQNNTFTEASNLQQFHNDTITRAYQWIQEESTRNCYACLEGDDSFLPHCACIQDPLFMGFLAPVLDCYFERCCEELSLEFQTYEAKQDFKNQICQYFATVQPRGNQNIGLEEAFGIKTFDYEM